MPDTVALNRSLATCFQIGKKIGLLQGHLLRAVFCNDQWLFRKAVRSWRSLEMELVTFDPLVQGQSLRERMRDDRKRFEEWYFDADSSGFSTLRRAALDSPKERGYQPDDQAKQSVVDALRELMPISPGEYETELLQQLVPASALALRVGRVVQEAFFPPGFEREMVSCESEHFSSPISDILRPASGLRVRYNVTVRPCRPGEIPPDTGWYREIRLLAGRLLPDVPLDRALARHPGTLMGFAKQTVATSRESAGADDDVPDQPVEDDDRLSYARCLPVAWRSVFSEVVGEFTDSFKIKYAAAVGRFLDSVVCLQETVYQFLRRHDAERNAAAGQQPPWPPDDGWHFRPGEYAIDGVTFRSSRQSQIDLLAAIHGRPISANALLDKLWPGDKTEDPPGRYKKLRGLMSRTGKMLERHQRERHRKWRIKREGRNPNAMYSLVADQAEVERPEADE